MPDTCVPTVTVVTACSAPVARTPSTIVPREIGSVLTVGSFSPRLA
jgi:hypothetical protein